MELALIHDKGLWDDFITAQHEHSFLHAWAWGVLNESEGDRIWRFGAYEGATLVAVALLISVRARRGNFFFIPQGPIIKDSHRGEKDIQHILQVFLDEFKRIGKKENVNFIRISPLLERINAHKDIFKALGFRVAPIHMHAEVTWTLRLDNGYEELLMDMRKTTRNLIRRAERDGVEIISGTSKEYIDEFFKLYSETSNRHNFVPFSYDYIRHEISAFAQEGDAKVYLAKWEGKTLSSAVVIFYGHSAFYHHGANSSEHQKIPAAYLLQWRAIQEAKNRGKQNYNFWGIAEDEENTSHPWHGLTFFKKGFGGQRTEYVHAQDIPLNKKYWINYAIDSIRRMRRGI